MLAVILVAVAIVLSLVLGKLASMTSREIVAQALAMSAAALIFYGLVELL
jgi:hypothetical protein